jgi:hypothetical protein
VRGNLLERVSFAILDTRYSCPGYFRRHPPFLLPMMSKAINATTDSVHITRRKPPKKDPPRQKMNTGGSTCSNQRRTEVVAKMLQHLATMSGLLRLEPLHPPKGTVKQGSLPVMSSRLRVPWLFFDHDVTFRVVLYVKV